jgi:hypothetical protein
MSTKTQYKKKKREERKEEEEKEKGRVNERTGIDR